MHWKNYTLIPLFALLLAGCREETTEPRWKATFSNGKSIELELALSNAEKAKGLSLIKEYPKDKGMIFVYPAEQPLRFWMKDCYIALDMMWIMDDGTISHISENVPPAPPGTPTHQISTRQGIGRYVLEMAAGEFNRLGITSGMKVTLPKDLPEGEPL